MVVDGKVKALTTGSDIQVMKDKLFYSFFHIPNPARIISQKNKSRRKAR